MKILFIGTVEFSLNSLKKIVSIGADVVGVCTREASAFNSDFADLVPLCVEFDIPYLLESDLNSEISISWIKNKNPDVIFCFGWSALLKKELLELAPLGVIGFHPAKLPHNRGRHPLIWPLVLGMSESASTFFFMDEGADTGDILSQRDFDISYGDDARSLYDKASEIALEQIEEFVPALKSNSYKRVPQNRDEGNTWRKRGKPDGKIDFRMSSRAIYNLVRGLTKPYVGAYVEWQGSDFPVWKVCEESCSDINFEPGKVLKSDNGTFLVKTCDGAVRILKHDFDVLPEEGEYL